MHIVHNVYYLYKCTYTYVYISSNFKYLQILRYHGEISTPLPERRILYILMIPSMCFLFFLLPELWLYHMLYFIMLSQKWLNKFDQSIFHHCFRYLAWHRTCAKPMSEPMMVSLLTHICAIRSQWVKHDNRTNTWKILFLVNPVAINLDLNMIFVNSNVTKLPYINLHH